MEIIARRSLVRKFGPCVDLCDDVYVIRKDYVLWRNDYGLYKPFEKN